MTVVTLMRTAHLNQGPHQRDAVGVMIAAAEIGRANAIAARPPHTGADLWVPVAPLSLAVDIPYAATMRQRILDWRHSLLTQHATPHDAVLELVRQYPPDTDMALLPKRDSLQRMATLLGAAWGRDHQGQG